MLEATANLPSLKYDVQLGSDFNMLETRHWTFGHLWSWSGFMAALWAINFAKNSELNQL